MKNLKQLFKQVAPLVLAFGLLLTACTPSSDGGTTTTTASTTTTQSARPLARPTATTQPTATPNKFGFDKRELENKEVTLWIPYEPGEDYLDDTREFERVYGGKVNYVVDPWSVRLTRLASLVQSGDSPDVISVYHGDSMSMIVRGLLEPIQDYTDINNSVYSRSIIDEVFSMNGNAYAAVGAGAAIPNSLFFNKTLYKRAGVKAPDEYVAENNWNWNTFRQACLEITEDADNDGINDLYGFATWHEDIFFIANGVDMVEMKNGKPVLNHKDSRITEALQFFQDMAVKDGSIFPHQVGWFEAFKNKQVAMLFESAPWQISRLQAEGFTDEIGIVPFPAGPSATEQVHYVTLTGFGICKNSANPEGAAAYIEVFQQHAYVEAFVDGADYKHLNDEQFAAMQSMMTQKVRVPLFYSFGSMSDRFFAMTAEIRNGQPVGTMLETYAPQFESDFNSIMEYSED